MRQAIKKQRLDDLQELKKQKMEAVADLEILQRQAEQIVRSLDYDMRSLEEKNLTVCKLTDDVKASSDIYKEMLLETNGYKKDIRNLQVEHEQLTHQTLRCSRDLMTLERKIELCQQDIEKLYDQYNQINRLLTSLTERADSLSKVRQLYCNN